MVGLGVLLAEQGNVEGARAAYQRVIDTGHPKWAPSVIHTLGVLLATQDEADGATPDEESGQS